jgi:hypothetical protein
VSRILEKMTDAVRTYPVCNSVLAGMSEEKMKHCVSYLETQFAETFKGANGLLFIRLEVVDPITAAKRLSNKKLSLNYDISRTDFALCYMHFEYQGKALTPLPLYVPVSGPILYIAGSPYIVRMVLSDKLLSPGESDIFKRVYRGKAKISRAPRTQCLLHHVSPEGAGTVVIEGDVLTGNYFKPAITASNRVTKSEPTLVLYLLAKFGYDKAMEMVLGFVPEVIDVPDIENAHQAGFQVFSTRMSMTRLAQVKATVGKNQMAMVTAIGFRIPEKQMASLPADQLDLLYDVMTTLFYILDGLPQIEIAMFRIPAYWLIPFRDTLYGTSDDDRKRELQARSHLEGLKNYVTDLVINDIHREFGDTLNQDFSTDGFFKLMVVLLHHYREWRKTSALISAAVTDKRLRLFYYMFIDVITQMNVINMLINNPKNYNLDENGVLKIIRGELNTGRMYRIKGGAGKKGASKKNQSVKPLASYGGDHKYFKVTSDLELQVNINSAMSSKGGSNDGDPTTLLDPGQCVGGTMNAITKTRLAATRYVNCYLPLDPETETIRFDDQVKSDLKHLKMVLGRTSHRPAGVSIPREFDIYGDDF